MAHDTATIAPQPNLCLISSRRSHNTRVAANMLTELEALRHTEIAPFHHRQDSEGKY